MHGASVRGEGEVWVVPSVLDRLLDEEPKSARDVPPTRAESVRDFRRAVLRDLDNLLNSRNTFFDLSQDFVEAGQSALTYGLPDLSDLAVWSYEEGDNKVKTSTPTSLRDLGRLRQAIETTIRRFEPRLTGVVATVTLARPTDSDQAVRVHVEARLTMDPAPEPVSFDIVMPRNTGKVEVKDRQ